MWYFYVHVNFINPLKDQLINQSDKLFNKSIVKQKMLLPVYIVVCD